MSLLKNTKTCKLSFKILEQPQLVVYLCIHFHYLSFRNNYLTHRIYASSLSQYVRSILYSSMGHTSYEKEGTYIRFMRYLPSFRMYLSSDYFNHALSHPQKIYINKWLLNMNYIRILHCYLLQLIYLVFVSLTLN